MRLLSSPLKWTGGKRRLLGNLIPLLPPGGRLIEPFVGAGNVFLATGYERYLLNDTNSALIAFYTALRDQPASIINQARALFTEANRKPDAYYALRQRFNAPGLDPAEKGALLLYLNKFGFNGLYRTNRQGTFNTPYGHPARLPGFPVTALQEMSDRLATAELMCGDFEQAMEQAGPGDVAYCDPPYVSLPSRASFTAYGQGGFDWTDQIRLLGKAWELCHRGVSVIISNHDTPEVRELYAGSTIHSFDVRRSVAADRSARGFVKELVAIFAPTDMSACFGTVEARLFPRHSPLALQNLSVTPTRAL